VNRSVLALGALVALGAPSLVAAQALTKCTVGESVTDQENKTGVVISAGSNLCQVKYADGQVYGWIYWNLRPATAPAQLGSPLIDPKLPAPPMGSRDAQSTTILRAAPSAHTLVYRADPRGHVTVIAAVNGTPVRFLVDTGASRVTLTAEDARVAGVGGSDLIFNQRSRTANGLAREAPVTLREIRIEQLSMENVAAAVNENLNISLLGMSFLKRLKSFEMRDGALTINW